MKHEILTVLSIAAGLLATCVRVAPAQANERETGGRIPAGKEVLAWLRKEHPGLLLTEERLRELKKLAQRDGRLQRIVRDVIRSADGDLRRPLLKYEKRGPRVLHVSRAMVSRAYALGLAWRWTGERKYVGKAVENLLAVCAFKDWNPSHFLDAAEMSNAVGNRL